MGVFGAAASYAIGVGVNYFQIKTLVLVGLALCFISVIPAAVMDPAQGFWATIFPSSILGGASAPSPPPFPSLGS